MDKRVTPEMVRSETLELGAALSEASSAADKVRGKVDTMLDMGAHSLISQEEIAHRRTELDRLVEEQQQVRASVAVHEEASERGRSEASTPQTH